MLSGATTWRWVFSPTGAQAVPVTGMVVASEVGLVGRPLLQGKKWGNNSGIREKGSAASIFVFESGGFPCLCVIFPMHGAGSWSQMR